MNPTSALAAPSTNQVLNTLSPEQVAQLVPQPPPIPDDDLRDLACFLAAEFHYDSHAALVATTRWYQMQIGEDKCSWRDAFDLRFLTADHCMNVTAMREQEATRRGWFSLRDFGRADVADAPVNRRMRAALIDSLPGRVNAGVIVIHNPDPDLAADGITLGQAFKRFCWACAALLVGAIAVLGIWS